MNKYILLLAVICTACTGAVCPVSETESESSVDTSSTSSSPAEEPECSTYVNINKCATTYPECSDEFDNMRFMTHASHDCETVPYPPKFCEYMGDVVCEGQTAGVWCCR